MVPSLTLVYSGNRPGWWGLLGRQNRCHERLLPGLCIGRCVPDGTLDVFYELRKYHGTWFVPSSAGFIRPDPHQQAFSVLYGLVGSCFLSLIPVCVASLVGTNSLATAVGLVVLSNSPGQLAGAPIASLILSASGNNWSSVSLFSGGIMILGGLCVLPGENFFFTEFNL